MSTSHGFYIFADSGRPGESTDYTTLVILHGFGWSSAAFAKLPPLAPKHNARVVLLNRRGYPGAEPYTNEDCTLLRSASSEDSEKVFVFMRNQAHELYDFLSEFVEGEAIPHAYSGENTGGIVLVGWSLAAVWMTAFLAHVDSFPPRNAHTNLSSYVRRVILHDPGSMVLGYAHPDAPEFAWSPLSDPSIPPEKRETAFALWLSGYFSHGDTLEQLEIRSPLPSPPPTVSTMTPEQYASAHTDSECDRLFVKAVTVVGLCDHLRKRAFYLPPEPSLADQRFSTGSGDWRNVEVRLVWCTHSVWTVPWGVWALRAELDEARKKGKALRNINIYRLEGANHFSHWDYPERTLRAFLDRPTMSSEK